MLDKENSMDCMSAKNLFLTSLISGAFAGTICDVTFYPLDTLKTRLQSQHGFVKSGGFKRLYQGLGPVMIGSAPSAAIFFVTYEGIKKVFQPQIPPQYYSLIHMTAAATGETVACLIRVPVEVVKQRKQALLCDEHRLPLKTLYRGYGSTVLRDLPFGLVQMPLWEYFKLCWKRHVDRECTPVESAICGSVSVAISAAMTTPLDVAKTRIMLSNTSADKEEVKVSIMLREVYRECGAKGLFAGFLPRVGGFTISGFVFFGVYEKIREICMAVLPS
ncbi:PREDICTED: S-adenosylmethionine mitochondrial carrier protein-like [Dufourea novaeangliae]|uniref:S-adenosylmethionine mitochondrial carrier protein n=1 Tax=Dufourea novaeangliae TaxID=178035 RepID=A0A154PM88_DUFNO|nr:PREDICTED: S-adenosylmethionine mitochondrial carrier protein-like [Dufourea novaeangliae]XP_015434890.1 PREDICTED: S-adenosylmethionine mitochondrial carrier protein-like [Dufourea novaeangliae]KZC12398.1 S-adenosylmethionine mitochondrial carrier protein [Dufourea novaeangliae]